MSAPSHQCPPIRALRRSWGTAVHCGRPCGVFLGGWLPGGARGCDVALGFLLFSQGFRVCSGRYYRFIKPQWLLHNAAGEGGLNLNLVSSQTARGETSQPSPEHFGIPFHPPADYLCQSTSTWLPRLLSSPCERLAFFGGLEL